MKKSPQEATAAPTMASSIVTETPAVVLSLMVAAILSVVVSVRTPIPVSLGNS
jgi:hypothetical protein